MYPRQIGIGLFFLLLLTHSINCHCHQKVYLENVNEAENTIFILTSPKSGSNLLMCSLQAIVRKPIGQLRENNTGIYHPIANKRLQVELISSIPMFYRTHYLEDMCCVNPDLNKIILLTRNPKELLFRNNLVSSKRDLKSASVNHFLKNYMNRLKFYDNWPLDNRRLVFYEDLITQEHNEEILLELIEFMEEDPCFLDDYLRNKEKYLNQIYSHYCNQHKKEKVTGKSAKLGPKKIYHTLGKSKKLLQAIDHKLKKMDPLIWEKYLQRFSTESD